MKISYRQLLFLMHPKQPLLDMFYIARFPYFFQLHYPKYHGPHYKSL
jgi:hypothetical protein